MRLSLKWKTMSTHRLHCALLIVVAALCWPLILSPHHLQCNSGGGTKRWSAVNAKKRIASKNILEKEKPRKDGKETETKLVAGDLMLLFHLCLICIFASAVPPVHRLLAAYSGSRRKQTTASLNPSAVKNPTSELLIRLLAPQCPLLPQRGVRP